MTFEITEKSGVEVEIKTPSFYTHYGAFYKLTDEHFITVHKEMLYADDVNSSQVERHLKAI